MNWRSVPDSESIEYFEETFPGEHPVFTKGAMMPHRKRHLKAAIQAFGCAKVRTQIADDLEAEGQHE